MSMITPTIPNCNMFDTKVDDDDMGDTPPTPVQDNPFVQQVASVQGFESEIELLAVMVCPNRR